MKIRTTMMLSVLLLIMAFTANAAYGSDGTLFELWLQYGDANDVDVLMSQDGASVSYTDEKIPVGGIIDGCEIADYTWDCLTGKDECYRVYNNYPLSAEGMLLMFAPYCGDGMFMGYDYGLLQKVNYQYGVSEVTLADSELFTVLWQYEALSYRIEYAIYRFSITMDDYIGDLLIIDENPIDDGYPDRYSVLITENDSSYRDARDYHPERGDIGILEVVNCDEWVSLRQEPSTKSDCICKVDTGKIVQAYYEENGFVYCNYEGLLGYIKADYLEKTSSCISQEEYLNSDQ